MTQLTNRTTTILATILFGHFGLSCTRAAVSDRNDIFVEDQSDGDSGNARRHPSSASERLFAIRIAGCTSHLIAPDIMMTAAHCQVGPGDLATSGSAENLGARDDIKVITILEEDKTLDYALVRISWRGGIYPKNQIFPAFIATQASDVQTGPNGDSLFTVGYPGDKRQSWGSTYSEGRARGIDTSGARAELIYNIGIINGSSGGGVWRQGDNMLVSLTNGGPNELGDSGWDTSSAEDESHWNNGPGMWQIYSVSAVLQNVFPGGRNRFATDVSTEPESDMPSAALFVALDTSATNPDQAFIHLSAPREAKSAIICIASSSPCTSANAILSTTMSTVGARAFFVSTGSLNISPDLQLTAAFAGASNQIIGRRTVAFRRQN